MAITHAEIVKEIKERPLTQDEINLVYFQEKYIDSCLKKQIRESSTKRTEIPSWAIEMQNFSNGRSISVDNFARRAMSEELKRRYVAAGWKISYESDPGDGPHPGYSHYVFEVNE